MAGLGDWSTAGADWDQARWVEERVAVVGAGPAGLAAGWAIRRAVVDPLIIERADAVEASRQPRHDHLRLNTNWAFSHQLGVRMPLGNRPFPGRDDYVARHPARILYECF